MNITKIVKKDEIPDINSQKNNTIIHLKNQTYNLNSTTIDNNITIIGNNSILKTNSTDNLFKITKNSNVILINLTIQDHLSGNMPTINNSGVLKLQNVIVKNHTCTERTSRGGAILNTGVLEITNSAFSLNKASWGASIYNNQAKVTITNSTFTADHTYNVGGSLYTIRGDVKIYDTYFKNNTAVSGAAIYNAFGNLSINHSSFYKNNAQSFYGGCIYSTGICYVNHTNFTSNHAQYSGGAITNTNNFTAYNCSFNLNTATDGGAIENIAWTATENGNLTLIRCNFTENSAGNCGGAIINFNSTDVKGNYGTITARGCIFDRNTAGGEGGAIANHQYIDLEYNMFLNNEANIKQTISSNNNVIKSARNNWWGENSPNWIKHGVKPQTWILMKFTNKTALVNGMPTKLEVTLNSLINNQTIDEPLPTTKVTIANKTYLLNGNLTIRYTPKSEVIAQIDNQKLTLKSVNATIKAITGNETLKINYNFPTNVNALTTVKIDGKTILNEQLIWNGKAQLNYKLPASLNREKYTLNIIINNDGNIMKRNITITIPKREVDLTLDVPSNAKIGDKIQIKTHLTCNGMNITTGKIAFKINGKTMQTNLKVINGIVLINYTIPDTFSIKKYNISVVYSGDNNKKTTTTSEILKINKGIIKLANLKNITIKKEDHIQLPVSLVDINNKKLIIPVKLCYKINNITYKTNITSINSSFIFDYITPKLSMKLTLTIKIGESKKYEQAIFNIPLRIE